MNVHIKMDTVKWVYGFKYPVGARYEQVYLWLPQGALSMRSSCLNLHPASASHTVVCAPDSLETRT